MLFVACFMALMVRIAYINFSDYSSAGQNQSQRTLTIGTTRGKIYDRNMDLLVDCESRKIAAVTPAIGSAEYLKDYFSQEILNERIEKGFPFTAQVKAEINNEFIRTFSVPVRYSGESLATHLIGYLNSEATDGVSGLEKSYNNYLKENGGKLTVSFDVDAKGRVLAGMDKYINDDNFNSSAGLVLTVDKRIQEIVEQELKNSTIKSGCAIVMHVNNGEIMAVASVPDYNANDVASYLTAENSPFINKVLQSYSVGSVFKPLISAAAIENGYDTESEYECTGSIEIGDSVFGCYNHKAHGKVNMEGALQNSCNTYFINLIMQLDIYYLLSLCQKIGLGTETAIADGITASEGKVPSSDSLRQKGNLANFAFGQGELMLTPVQMVKLYHLLATGKYIEPTVILGFADKNGAVTEKGTGVPQKLLKDETVTLLRSMLLSVTEKGNATNAKSDKIALAGKTGTAQSGIYENGKEICRTWFSGFFPAKNPHYIVVVLNEKGEGGNADCAPVYRKICERIVFD